MFAKIIYGNYGGLLMKIIVIVDNFGACCAYYRIFGESTHALMQVLISDQNSYLLTNWNNYFYILLIFLVMTFLIFKDDIHSLKHISFLGVAAIIVFVLCLIIIFIYKYYLGHIQVFDYSMLFPDGGFINIITSLPSVFVAYTFQFNVFPIFFTLKSKTNYEMLKATIIGVGFCFIIYLSTGILGFLIYRNQLDDTILKAFANDILVYKDKDFFLLCLLILINISFLLSTSMSIPLLFFSLKRNFLNTIIFIHKRFSSESTNRMRIIEEDNDLNGNLLQNNQYLTYMEKTVYTIILHVSICGVTIVIPQLKSV